MAHRKTEKALTPDEVHGRLLSMLREKYNDRVDLMALELRIDKYYLRTIIRKQRNAPRWLLDRLGVMIRSHKVIEYYVEA